ncbi:hypothetical protein Tco_1452900 [Tanacetum coccineum]
MVPSKGFFWPGRRSIKCSSEGVRLFRSEVVSRELIVVARPEVARRKLVVARPELARPELVVARLKVAQSKLVVAHPELVVVARPETLSRLETFGVRPEIDLISFGDIWDDTNDDSNATLEPITLIKELGEEAYTLPTIAPAEAPQSRSEGVSEGKDATTNKLNEDADPNGRFPDDGFDDDDRDKIGNELLHLAPSPYCMPYPYDEGLSSHPLNMKGEWGEVHVVKLGILKKELFKDPKMRKAIIDRVPTPTQLLRAEGLTLKELSEHINILMCLKFLMGAYKLPGSKRSRILDNGEKFLKVFENRL